MEKEFLTEKGLGEILNFLYAPCEIIPQYSLYNKKWDYAVKFNKNHFYMLPESIGDRVENYEEENYAENDEDNDEDNDEENGLEEVTLLIEFDGHYHYTRNSVVAYDENGLEWHMLDSDVFLFRIPYYVQLDKVLTKIIFGVDKDFSKGFPHGFVSKKVHLPEDFCSAGEERLIKELALLPKEITLQVVESLIAKTGYPSNFSPKKMARTASLKLWDSLLTNFHPTYRSILEEMRDVSPDNSKYYKHFSPALYVLAEMNPIIGSIYFGRYMCQMSKEGLNESIEAYCRWHGMSKKMFNKLTNKNSTSPINKDPSV